MAFACLKEVGVGCEFITEQARLYIAKKRYNLGLKPEEAIVLTDEDQIAIMHQQIAIEEMMSTVIGDDHVVISDSSALNSMLYMTEEQRRHPGVQQLALKAIQDATLVFYAPPVPRPSHLDPNRVHSEQESIRVDASIPFIISTLDQKFWETVVKLEGEPQARLGQVTSAILTRRFAR